MNGRGVQGVQGEDGQRGEQGKRGVAGEIGPAGESSPYLGKRQTLALFAFIVLAFLLLAYRSEVNADRIGANSAKISATQQASCESGLQILIKFNTQQNALIAAEMANTGADPETRAARIKAYEEGLIEPLPICMGPMR